MKKRKIPCSILFIYLYFLFYSSYLKKKFEENNFHLFLKTILYFTLFLKIVFKEQPNNVIKV